MLCVVQMLQERRGVHLLVLQLPIGAEDTFRSVVDPVEMGALLWSGVAVQPIETVEIPDDLREHAASFRARLIEAVVEQDDTLLQA